MIVVFVYLCSGSLKIFSLFWVSLSSALRSPSQLCKQPNKSAHSQSSLPFTPLTKRTRRAQPQGNSFSWNPETGALMKTWDVVLTGEQRDFIGVHPCREFLAFAEAEPPERSPLLPIVVGLQGEGPSAQMEWNVEVSQAPAVGWWTLLKNNNSTNILCVKRFTFAPLNMPEQSSLGKVLRFTGSDVFYFSSHSCNSGFFVINVRGNV